MIIAYANKNMYSISKPIYKFYLFEIIIVFL
jgi:hypothetical protein